MPPPFNYSNLRCVVNAIDIPVQFLQRLVIVHGRLCSNLHSMAQRRPADKSWIAKAIVSSWLRCVMTLLRSPPRAQSTKPSIWWLATSQTSLGFVAHWCRIHSIASAHGPFRSETSASSASSRDQTRFPTNKLARARLESASPRRLIRNWCGAEAAINQNSIYANCVMRRKKEQESV